MARMLISLFMACALMMPLSAYAGEWSRPTETEWAYEEAGIRMVGWQQIDGLWYYFNEDGIMQTGWVRDPGSELWYYTDTQTGAWIEKPAITVKSVTYLLENAIKKAGYYQNEACPVEIAVTGEDSAYVYASVRIITGPNSYTNLNNYVISKKTGKAEATYKTGLYLYG